MPVEYLKEKTGKSARPTSSSKTGLPRGQAKTRFTYSGVGIQGVADVVDSLARGNLHGDWDRIDVVPLQRGW